MNSDFPPLLGLCKRNVGIECFAGLHRLQSFRPAGRAEETPEVRGKVHDLSHMGAERGQHHTSIVQPSDVFESFAAEHPGTDAQHFARRAIPEPGEIQSHRIARSFDQHPIFSKREKNRPGIHILHTGGPAAARLYIEFQQPGVQFPVREAAHHQTTGSGNRNGAVESVAA